MHRIHVVVTDSGQHCCFFCFFSPSHFSTGACFQDRYCGVSSSDRHERHGPVTWQSQPQFINRKCIQPNKHEGDEEVLDSKHEQQISPYAGFKVVPVALKCCWQLLYSTVLHSHVDSLHSHVILHEWIAFYCAFLKIHRSGVLTALAVQWQGIRQPTQAPAVALFSV